MFHYFLSDGSKQDASTTATNSKHIMELLHNIKVLITKHNIWDNANGCAKKYRRITELYLLSMLSHAYNIASDCDVGEPVHRKYFVDGLNATNKRFLSMPMTAVQLPCAANNNSQIVMHTSMSNIDISLSREFHFFQNQHVHMNLSIMEKKGADIVRINVRSASIMFRTANMYNQNH